MKLILGIVMVMVASLAATSVDAVPDPPAVNPHVLNFKIAGLRALPNTFDGQNWSSGTWAWVVVPLPLPRFGWTQIVQPDCAGHGMAVVACAADPSPPTPL